MPFGQNKAGTRLLKPWV